MKEVRKIVRAILRENNATRIAFVNTFKEKYGDMEEIGQTRTGALFRDSSGTIVKLTSDKSEYDNALHFIKKPHKNFIKYYSAEPLEVGDETWYVLYMEEIKELGDDDWAVVDMINNTLGTQDYMLDDQRRYSFIAELKRNPEWYEDIASYKEIIKTLQDIYTMYKEAARRGIRLHDARSQNMGRTNDGRLVHFDIGAG